MSNLHDTIKKVQAIIADDSPIVFPEPKQEEPLLSEEDADRIALLTAQRYLEAEQGTQS